MEEQRRAASAPRREAAGEPPAGPPLPYLVLLLDSWQELATCWESVDHGRPVEALLRVLREGRAVGVRAVLTGDRSVLLSRVGSVVADRLVLRMADATDLLMAGISGDAVPSHQPAGRAVRVGDSVEMQLALLAGGTDGPGQNAALEAIGLSAASTRDGADGHAPAREPRPFRVDALPTDVSLSQLRGTPRQRQPSRPTPSGRVTATGSRRTTTRQTAWPACRCRWSSGRAGTSSMPSSPPTSGRAPTPWWPARPARVAPPPC